MAYINEKNEYPLYLGDVWLVNPNYKPGDELPSGWSEVQELERPQPESDNHVIELGKPVLADGVWTVGYTQRLETPEETATRLAPITAKEKLTSLGFTEEEIFALISGMVR